MKCATDGDLSPEWLQTCDVRCICMFLIVVKTMLIEYCSIYPQISEQPSTDAGSTFSAQIDEAMRRSLEDVAKDCTGSATSNSSHTVILLLQQLRISSQLLQVSASQLVLTAY